MSCFGSHDLEVFPFTVSGVIGGLIVLGPELFQILSQCGLSWFIEGRNLTDETCAATTSVIANANGADAAVFNPGEGRGVYAGIEWKL